MRKYQLKFIGTIEEPLFQANQIGRESIKFFDDDEKHAITTLGGKQ
jgi:hypothetical protein